MNDRAVESIDKVISTEASDSQKNKIGSMVSRYSGLLQFSLNSMALLTIVATFVGGAVYFRYCGELGLPVNMSDIPLPLIGIVTAMLAGLVSVEILFAELLTLNRESLAWFARNSLMANFALFHLLPVFVALTVFILACYQNEAAPWPAVFATFGGFTLLGLIYRLMQYDGPTEVQGVLMIAVLDVSNFFLMVVYFPLVRNLFEIQFNEDWQTIAILYVLQAVLSLQTFLGLQGVKSKSKKGVGGGFCIVMIYFLVMGCTAFGPNLGKTVLASINKGGGRIRNFWLVADAAKVLPRDVYSSLVNGTGGNSNLLIDTRLCLWGESVDAWYVSPTNKDEGKLCRLTEGLKYQEGIFAVPKATLKIK